MIKATPAFRCITRPVSAGETKVSFLPGSQHLSYGDAMAHTMTDDELLENLDFPTLSSVVESGDETIIQTSRIGHEVIRELRSISAYSEPHIHVGADSSSAPATSPIAATNAGLAQSPQTDHQLLAQIIESKVASVVEKHVTALKKDINSAVLEALEQHKKHP